jgi:hypothetical protein
MKLPFSSHYSFGAALALLISLSSANVQSFQTDLFLDPTIQQVQADEIKYPWENSEDVPRIGLQVGHWNNHEAPAELASLKGNTGASGGGKTEWEINFAIAERAAQILTAKGLEVDLLPAIIPPRYQADAFIAIHADGSLNPDKSGYKMAAPWNDQTGKADSLVAFIEEEYASTGLEHDYKNITPAMRGYYSFAWWNFEHAVDPSTPSAIVETGFLSSPRDQELLIHNPDVPAEAIAAGILRYLKSQTE